MAVRILGGFKCGENKGETGFTVGQPVRGYRIIKQWKVGMRELRVRGGGQNSTKRC